MAKANTTSFSADANLGPPRDEANLPHLIYKLREAYATVQFNNCTALVDARELGNLADRLGLGVFVHEDVMGLWRMGLLRADYISGHSELVTARFSRCGTSDEGQNEYADHGKIQLSESGYTTFFGTPDAEEKQLTVLFHPWKFFVLHHVVRTMRVRTSGSQYLRWPRGIFSVAEHERKFLDDWTKSESFADRFDYWNQISELAIACEPVALSRSPNILQSEKRELQFHSYREFLNRVLRAIGTDEIHEKRERLALTASEHDGNSRIHTLLRLIKAPERDRLVGHLGCAMRLLWMAEVIRRAAEHLLQVALPEEDELGPGTWFPGARRMLYGVERVFDAPRTELRDFLGSLGLDPGTKVRCYVEGPTELGALRYAVGDKGQCIFVNLKGSVAERGGKGLAFQESLIADMNAHVFSVIVLDRDRTDFVRTVHRAASNNAFFGEYHMFSPDIELGNFTTQELVEIAIRTGQSNLAEVERSVHERDQMIEAVRGAASGDEFFQRLRNTGLSDVVKGIKWGEALMSYAIEQPLCPHDHPLAGSERPIYRVAALLLRAQDAAFKQSQHYAELDAASGKLIDRKHPLV
jgi:hypothetical protein